LFIVSGLGTGGGGTGGAGLGIGGESGFCIPGVLVLFCTLLAALVSLVVVRLLRLSDFLFVSCGSAKEINAVKNSPKNRKLKKEFLIFNILV
jgi:hypothetical protein